MLLAAELDALAAEGAGGLGPEPQVADEAGNRVLLGAERGHPPGVHHVGRGGEDRKSTRLNSSHVEISYAVFCLKKKKKHKYSSYLHHKRSIISRFPRNVLQSTISLRHLYLYVLHTHYSRVSAIVYHTTNCVSSA